MSKTRAWEKNLDGAKPHLTPCVRDVKSCNVSLPFNKTTVFCALKQQKGGGKLLDDRKNLSIGG